MIIERREYALTPCRLNDYWDAYERWNRWLADDGMLRHTLAFFQTLTGPKCSIVNLSTFDSFEQRAENFQRIYAGLSRDYIDTVRPWYLSQESVFYEPSPLDGGQFPEHAAVRAMRAHGRSNGDAGRLVILETRMDLRAQGLAAYAKAFGGLAARGAVYRENLIGRLQSTSGRLFRMLEYRWFADATAAHDHALSADRDPEIREVMREIEPYVVETHAAHLTASPLPWMRPMFEVMDD
jgi:hypothetical protein